MTSTLLLIRAMEGYFKDASSDPSSMRQSFLRDSTYSQEREVPSAISSVMSELHQQKKSLDCISKTLTDVVEKQEQRQQDILEALRGVQPHV